VLAQSARGSSSAQHDLQRGLALASQSRWQEAAAALRAGQRLEPWNPRFPEELAGVAYRQNDYGAAIYHLMRALALSPHDTYAADFLGTIYFLQGNLEAALKYWNQAGKPVLSDAVFRVPDLDPLILDRAFRFSPDTVWQLSRFRDTEAQLASLNLFPAMRFTLTPRQNGSFLLTFQPLERPRGFGFHLDTLASLLRGLPYLALYPQFYNINHAALNARSYLRWDSQKRRASAELAGPLPSGPQRRARLWLDARNENWNIGRTLTPGTPAAAGFNLQRAAGGVSYTSIASWRSQWSAGAEYSWRRFRAVSGVPATAQALLAGAQALTVTGMEHWAVLRVPEHRFMLNATGTGEFGSFYTAPLGRYAQAQGQLHAAWLPQANGQYQLQSTLRSGGTIGRIPLDDLYMLGFDRDNPLWLRGHNGLIDGRKGNAPLGANYVLSNTDFDRSLLHTAFASLWIGPFLDMGQLSRASGYFGSAGWLTDGGVQASVGALGSFTYAVGYGRDFRSGANTLYTAVSGWPFHFTNPATALH
jgi:tetratricopeptide (TPR) repeat protein